MKRVAPHTGDLIAFRLNNHPAAYAAIRARRFGFQHVAFDWFLL
jgi:hypothetical protein